MTTEDNKAIARRIIDDIINGGNPDAVDELVATDFIDHAGGMNGRDGYKQSIAGVRSAFPDLKMTVEDLIAEGDKVVARLSIEATHKGEFMGIAATGKRVAFTGIGIIRVADGQMVERWNNSDMLSLLQQIGAIPSPAKEQK